MRGHGASIKRGARAGGQQESPASCAALRALRATYQRYAGLLRVTMCRTRASQLRYDSFEFSYNLARRGRQTKNIVIR